MVICQVTACIYALWIDSFIRMSISAVKRRCALFFSGLWVYFFSAQVLSAFFFLVCLCVLLCLLTRSSWYWGIVTVPGFPRVNRPQTTWGGRILTLHLNYVACYTGSLLSLFLFQRTHNYPVDNQGLVPRRLRCLGESKVRSASFVRVLSGGKIPWVQWSQDLRNPPPLTTKQSNIFVF